MQAPIRLEAEVESASPVWVQIAETGTFKGYHGGEFEFTFDRALFDDIVKNFRTHPQYKAGDDGVGKTDVVPWDIGHNSEVPEHLRTAEASAAQGWILELEVRAGGEDGREELWALTRWLEPLRTLIKEEKYKWASVSVVFDAVDPISGKSIGALLTSVAATNTPFLETLQQLAASRWYESAGSPEQALDFMQRMFGLPALASSSDLADQMTRLKKLMGDEPDNTTAKELFEGLSKILGMPVLATESEVFAKVDELLAGQRSNSESDNGVSGSPNPSEASAAKEDESMELLKALAAKLGCKDTERAVLDEIEALLELVEQVKATLSCERNASHRVILGKAKDKVDSTDGLRKLLTALEVEGVDAAVAKAVDLIIKAADLKALMPELEELRASKKTNEDQKIDAEVTAVMAAKGYGEELRPALTLLRRTDAKGFAEKYPAPPAGQAYLTANIATGSSRDEAPAVRAAAGSDPKPKTKVDLSNVHGRNLAEKATNWVKAQPGGDKLSWDEVCERAHEILQPAPQTAA